MKKAIYDKLDDIPQADRDENNYQLATDGPNAGKYVLIIEGTHPVMVKNTQLLAQQANREIDKQQAVAAAIAPKDQEIARLSTELQTARTQSGLSAGQVEVAEADAQLLNQFKALGAFDDVKAKIDEHGTLKEQTEAVNRKTLFAEAAKAHGLDPEAFATLAEQQKLHEKLEMREVPDPKDAAKKVKHYFVKGKDAQGADSSVVLGEFVESDSTFKPFLTSLKAAPGKATVRVPSNGTGDAPKETSAAKSYINSRYAPKQSKAAGEQ